MTALAPQNKTVWEKHVSPADMLTTNFPKYALRDRRLSRTALRALMALGVQVGRNSGSAWPAQSTIGELMGVGRRKAGQLVAQLEDLGYLLKVERRNRKWLYQLVQPEIDNAPTEGALRTDGKPSKKFEGGAHDLAPTGGAQTNLNSFIPLTPLCGEAEKEEELRASPDGSEVTLSASASPQTSGSASGPARLQVTKSLLRNSVQSASQAPYSPITEASKHMSRQDVARLIGRATATNMEQALREFGFDYRGKPANTPGKATLTEEVNHDR